MTDDTPVGAGDEPDPEDARPNPASRPRSSTSTTRSRSGPTPTSRVPTLRLERQLLRAGATLVAGMDEVGRGALAGPVSVGVCVIDLSTATVPQGVKDSKLVPEARRPGLAAAVRRWAVDGAVGHTQPDEIDALGMTRALRLAGTRALAALTHRPDVVILDGKHDWLTDPETVGLFSLMTADATPTVTTQIKADMRCSSVAGASLLAKVERDAIMVELAAQHPAYGWEINKGYSAPAHLAAIDEHGPCVLHRRSWKTFRTTRETGDTRGDA